MTKKATDKKNKISTKSTTIKDKKKKFLDVYKAKAGNITDSCKSIGIDRRTFYNWIEKDDKFKSTIDDIQESLIDLTESKLIQNIKKNDTTSIIFYLKNRVKNRGYTQKIET
jgi:hypothetical protein